MIATSSTHAGPLARAAAVVACLAPLAACGSTPEARYVSHVPAKIVAPEGAEVYALGRAQAMVQTDVSGGGSYTLTFGEVGGTLTLSPSVPASSTLALDVQMGTATASWQVVADIAMSDFLHAPAHPQASFLTRSLRPVPGMNGDDAAPNLEVYADFTLHGTKKTVVVPGRLDIDACRARFRCAFTIQRSTFGTVDDGTYETFVSDDAVVRIAVDVPRRSAPASCVAAKQPPT